MVGRILNNYLSNKVVSKEILNWFCLFTQEYIY
jgi:hypothetical protein